MEFAATRFYPVDLENRIVYLDTQLRKGDCSKIPGATGVIGFQLNNEWEAMVARGFTLEPVAKERRGGAGRGQGRHPNAIPISTVKLKIPQIVHGKLQEHVVTLRRRSGKVIAMQDYASELVLKADVNLVAPALKRISSDPAWLHITDAASDRLDVLVKRVAAVRSDVRVSRPSVFSAIVLLAIGEA